jgi:large subunit ribosomal protein L21
MKYAVIKTGGKQYRVSEGDVIEVDRLDSKPNDKIVFDNVLLVVSDTGVKIGKPVISGEKVEAKLLDNIKGDKIRIAKFKAKVRYRKVMGFRASLSKVQIDKIGTKTEKPVVEKEKILKKASKASK